MTMNKISAEIPQENETLVQQHLTDTATLLDCLVNLTPEERMRMAKMGRKDLDFVERSLRHAEGTPEYLPSYIPLDEFRKDVQLVQTLKRVHKEVEDLYTKLNDTILQVSAEAYQTSRIYYKSVKTASKEGAEGAEVIYKDLARHYKKSSNPKPEEEPSTEEPVAEE